MKLLNKVFLFFVVIKGFSANFDSYSAEEKPFVILIASYNNERYAKENILSALNQYYSNYRIIFINDCSSDATLEIVKNTVRDCNAEDKVIVIDNIVRKLGLRNYYEAIINLTKDEEIIVCLDGDDFLANRSVLWILNRVYSGSKKEIWLTYGQFAGLNNKTSGWNEKISESIIKNNEFRKCPNIPTHLRTFYSWLFKRINVQDLIYKDHFFEMTWDFAFMLPMLEMSGGRFAFISRLLYLYNDNNPINDHKVNLGLQMFYADYIRSLPKYKPLKHSIFEFCSDEDCIVCNKSIKNEIYHKQ